MNSHLRLLKQMIADEMYVVDGRSVADAILARATVRTFAPGTSFRSESQRQPPVVRSFRRDNHARSFRLERREKLYHAAY